MKCPNCGLENPQSAIKCDCGHNFSTGIQEAPLGIEPGRKVDSNKTTVPPESQKYGCLFLLLIAIILIIIYNSNDSQDRKIPKPKPTKEINVNNGSEWISPAARIYSGVKLYYGPQKMYVGEVICWNEHYVDPITGMEFRGVKIRFPSGSEEWKDRNAIINGPWYIKSDDPALEKMEGYECVW